MFRIIGMSGMSGMSGTSGMVCALCVSLGIAAGTAGCGANTPTAPTVDTPNPVTVLFSGALNQNSAATHRFTTQTSGEVRAALTTVQPDSSIAVGLSLGTWNGNSCAIVIDKNVALQGSLVLGNVSGIGELCVRIYEIGRAHV